MYVERYCQRASRDALPLGRRRYETRPFASNVERAVLIAIVSGVGEGTDQALEIVRR